MDDRQLNELQHQLISVAYNKNCDCRRVYEMAVEFHPKFHDEQCPYRIQLEHSTVGELFND